MEVPPVIRTDIILRSHTQATSTPVTVPSAIRTVTSGSRAVLTVSSSLTAVWTWLIWLVIDVINVSGHRLSTAEIESALILFPGVAEAAVIGANDELTGQAVHAFVTLKPYVPFSFMLYPH